MQLGEAEAWKLQDGMLQEAAVGWGCLGGNLIRLPVSGTVADRVKQCRGTAVQAHLECAFFLTAPLQAVTLLIFLLSCSSSERTLFGFVDRASRGMWGL